MRARRTAAVAVALGLCCAGTAASAASPMPTSAATAASGAPAASARYDETVVVGGIRPGPRKLACPGFVAHLIYDYEAGAFDSPGAAKTPATAVRRHFDAPGRDSTLDGLRYERRSAPAGMSASERRNYAVFVGMNKNRKVKARFTLARGGSKPVKKWLVSSVESCAKKS